MGPESPGARDDGRSSPSRRSARHVSALKIPVALFCVFGVGIAGYYFLYVKQQTRYVEGRNFRVLATIGDIGIVTAIAATLPTLIKAVSLVGGRTGSAGS